jgi:signal transduction histidine kinase/CheY-like chemotaxis protein
LLTVNEAIKIKRKLILVVWALLGVTIIVLSFFVYNKAQQVQVSTVIDLAGRQRMLSQRIAKNALLLASRDYQDASFSQRMRDDLAEINQRNNDLLYGNDREKILPAFNQSLSEQYMKQAETLKKIEEQVQCLTTLSCPDKDKINRELLSSVDVFFTRMDSMVHESASVANSRSWWFFIIDGLLLAGIFGLALFFIMRAKYFITDEFILQFNALNEKKAFTDHIEEVAHIGFWELDVITGVTKWSDEVYRIHKIPIGTPTTKVKGIHFYAPHERTRITQYVEKCIENHEKYDEVFEFIDAHGNHKWVRVIGSPILDAHDQVVRLVGLFQDITEIKKRELENNLILSSTSAGVWKWDIVNNDLQWDQGMYKVYGVREEDFGGAYEAWQTCLHPESKEVAERELEQALKGEKEFNTTIKIQSPKDGSIRYLGARGKVEFNDKGEPIRMVGINWDKTSEIKSQMDLDEKTRLANHTAKLASIGELAAGVGHEINNPLAILQGHLGNLMFRLKQMDVLDESMISKKFEVINLAIVRIHNITKGLRTFSRRDDGQMTEVDMREVVVQSIDLIESIYSLDGIEIRKKGLGFAENLWVMGNVGSLQQVIMNFFSNAKDALCDVPSKVIEVELSGDDSKAVLKVRNSGPKIPAENIDRIFDPFFTTKEVGQGTGIGLTISRNIVEDFGGSLTHLIDEPLTTFCVELPRVEAPPINHNVTPINQVSPNRALELEGLSVLIAEDEPDIGEFLLERLEDMRCQAVWAPDGEQAYQLYKRRHEEGRPFDLVLSDVKMPRRSGVGLLRGIREIQANQSPYFILMSGGVDFDIANSQDPRLQGIDAHLEKPFSDAKLMAVLKAFQEQTSAKRSQAA